MATAERRTVPVALPAHKSLTAKVFAWIRIGGASLYCFWLLVFLVILAKEKAPAGEALMILLAYTFLAWGASAIIRNVEKLFP